MALYDYQGNVISTGGSGGSPITGKRIAMIGDSNTQYSGETFKAYMEETYGCTFIPLGHAGATWETTAGVGATDNSAVGRVNKIIANADGGRLITEYDMIVIMMGTNLAKMGTPTDLSSNVSTMCGAVRYCMEKLCYYGRQIPIGVIIPFRADSDGTAVNTEFEYIEQIAKEFSVPTLNLYTAGRIIPNSMTPDGSNFYLGDGVHLAGNGNLQVERIMGKWIAYEL